MPLRMAELATASRALAWRVTRSTLNRKGNCIIWSLTSFKVWALGFEGGLF